MNDSAIFFRRLRPAKRLMPRPSGQYGMAAQQAAATLLANVTQTWLHLVRNESAPLCRPSPHHRAIPMPEGDLKTCWRPHWQPPISFCDTRLLVQPACPLKTYRSLECLDARSRC